nr:YoaK family protein [uncultured Anaerotignum sp.]
MMIYSKRQMSDTFLIAVLLAVVGGSLDAYTYVARGHVFANAQTGNIVLFGLHMAEGEWLSAVSYFIPVLAFVLGVFIDEWIKKFFSPLPKVHWRQIVLLFEIAMLSIVAWLPFGETNDLVANILVSFVCSMQAQSFRKVHGLPYASTMCTGNLRSGTELLFRFVQSKDKELRNKSLHYYGVIIFFIFGAGCGALVTQHFGSTTVVYCNLLLLLVCALLSIEHVEE